VVALPVQQSTPIDQSVALTALTSGEAWLFLDRPICVLDALSEHHCLAHKHVAHEQHVSLMLLGTVVAGTGLGAAFSGSMRTVMPQAEAHERAGLLSAFYVEGYLSLILPVILTGLAAPIAGLLLAVNVYGAVVIVLALGSLLAMLRSANEWCE
jgi:hypothetical protein